MDGHFQQEQATAVTANPLSADPKSIREFISIPHKLAKYLTRHKLILSSMSEKVRIELHYFLFGALITLLLLAFFFFMKFANRVKQLTRLDYDIQMPPIPPAIIERIQKAEAAYYFGASWGRKIIEQCQDVMTLLFPRWVYRLNFSVGRMRMKPHTIRELLSWAIKNQFLKLHTRKDDKQAYLLAYFAMQPFVSRWQAGVYLAYLRELHPVLRSRSWDDIEQDTRLVQKLYSGYMGAGGDWETWLKTAEPGPEAVRRFGLTN